MAVAGWVLDYRAPAVDEALEHLRTHDDLGSNASQASIEALAAALDRLSAVEQAANALMSAIDVDEEWDHLISNPRTTEAASALARSLA